MTCLYSSEGMGNIKVSWLPEEDDLLDRYAVGELTLADVCGITGRSKQAVSGRAHSRGKTKRVWNSKLPSEMVDQVAGLYRNGQTVKDVGGATHLSYYQVRWCLRQAGITPDRNRASKMATKDQVRVLNEVEQGIVRRGWFEGLSVDAISKEVGCWKRVVWRFVASQGLTRPRASLKNLKRTKFNPDERKRIVDAFTTGGLNRDAMCRLFGVSWLALHRTLVEEGVDVKFWVSRKNSDQMRAAFASGVRVVSPKAGNGHPTPCDTPFQGTKIMRSTTEAHRGTALNATGKAWFYEVTRFPLDGHQYIPDFWVTEVSVADALKVLGPNPTRQEIRSFLDRVPYRIEEVKGWWGPTHPSKPKVDAFRLGFPTILFDLVVEDRKSGGWKWL